MTNGVTIEVIAGRLQVVLGVVVALQDPQTCQALPRGEEDAVGDNAAIRCQTAEQRPALVQLESQARPRGRARGLSRRGVVMASIAKLAKLARSHLAPSGVMRAGINLSNVLLVTGADARGAPIGVAPDMAAELARRLGVPVQLEPFAHPDVLCEAATAKRWDIALVGADPARAEHIAFSPAYCEIQCTYLVRANDRSRFASPADVDVPGARIAVKGGGAYDLWLARHLRHAEIVRAATLDASFELFVDQGLDALAGLRPKLLDDSAKGDYELLDEPFMRVQQALGCLRVGEGDAPAAALAYLREFAEDAVASGFVEALIQKHGVTGRLSVAQPS